MTKNKTEIKIPVEEVENLLKSFEWISSTLEFWKLYKSFPCNLISKVCTDYQFYLDQVIHDQYWNKKTPKS